MAEVIIAQLFISPGHNFFGRHGRAAGQHPACSVDRVRCRAGRGLEGDRFFDYRPDYSGQVTFFDAAVVAALRRELGDAFSFNQPQGGLFFWGRLTGAGGAVADGQAFAKKAIEHNVAFVPGAPFFADQPDLASLRLSFATSDLEKIETGVKRLGAALKE